MSYLYLFLAMTFSATITVGGLMITIIISLVFFGEKLRPLQWLGLAVGCISLVLLNL